MMLDGTRTLMLEEQPPQSCSTLEIRGADVLEEGVAVATLTIDGAKALIDYGTGVNRQGQAHSTQIKLERQDERSFHVLMLTEVEGELVGSEYGELRRAA